MLETYITSFIDGRVRLRHPALHDTALAERVHMLLSRIPGVQAVTVRPRLGSLLLEYDPAQLSKENLLAMMRQWGGLLGFSAHACAGSAASGASTACKSNTITSLLRPFTGVRTMCYVNRGLLASLAASVGFLAAGNIRGHALASCVFVALSACHIGAYRKTL